MEGDASLRVGPIIRKDEAARARRADDGTGGIVELDAEQAGFLAVDAYLQRGRIKRLRKLDISQFGYFLKFFADRLCVRTVVRQGRSAHGDFDWGRCAETHDAADDIRWLKRKAYVWHRAGQLAAQVFFGGFEVHFGAGFQLYLQGGFICSAVPGMNQVHRIIRRMHAYESESRANVIHPKFGFDDPEGL